MRETVREKGRVRWDERVRETVREKGRVREGERDCEGEGKS